MLGNTSFFVTGKIRVFQERAFKTFLCRSVHNDLYFSSVLVWFHDYNKTFRFTTFVEVKVNTVLTSCRLLQSCPRGHFIWWVILAEAMHQICAGHPNFRRPMSSLVCRSLIELPSRRQYCLCQSGLSVWSFDVVVFLCTFYGHIFQDKIIQWPAMNGANVAHIFKVNCSLSQNMKNHT
jgi:hypothetical protein